MFAYFNGTIWECIPKTTFATLPNLKFGVYNDVYHSNIRMKASVLIFEKLFFVSVVYMLMEFKKRNLKRGQFGKQASESKIKLRRQILRGKKK